jgi:hypothetical protein
LQVWFLPPPPSSALLWSFGSRLLPSFFCFALQFGLRWVSLFLLLLMLCFEVLGFSPFFCLFFSCLFFGGGGCCWVWFSRAKFYRFLSNSLFGFQALVTPRACWVTVVLGL